MKLFARTFETGWIQSVTCVKRQRYYLKTRICYSHTKFKCYPNKLNHLLKLSKTNYFNEYFMINKAKTKEIWKGIKSKGSTLPSNLSINEQEITSNNAITDQLDRFFSSSGKNLTSATP